jgi:toxin ParE1/3/4
MKGYVLSPRAQKDIDDIWEYTVEHWNVRQAEIYLRQIQRAIETVAAEPKIARSCDEIRPGYWKYGGVARVVFPDDGQGNQRHSRPAQQNGFRTASLKLLRG